MNKQKLQSIISKYYLGGLIESVKWEIKDKLLTVRFNSPTKDMIGMIQFNDVNLPDAEIAIYDTSQLDKLISITSDQLNLMLLKQGKIYSKLMIEDSTYELVYPLADVFLIKNPGKVTQIDGFDISCQLNSDIVSAIIKAKNALPNVDTVVFNLEEVLGADDDYNLMMIFGEDTNSYTNKIKYKLPNSKIEDSSLKEMHLPFNSEILKLIISNNKDFFVGHMYLNPTGLLKLEFAGEGWSSEYFIVRKSETD